jgi:hypothetical protein
LTNKKYLLEYWKEKERKKMMNVNLSLDRDELELLNVSLRCNLREIEKLANSPYIDEDAKNRYKKQVAMVPRVLDILTNLQVQRILHDCGIVKTVEA